MRNFFDSYARRRKVIPEASFNQEDDKYPEIMEQIALRGWRRLAAPRTDISKLLVQEFYANAAMSDEEAAAQEELPYKSFVRGKEVDFSPNNIRRVMRFKRETTGALTDFKTRETLNQRLDEPLARGWQEFIIHSLVPMGNKSEIAISRAILIHTIMQGEDVRAEEIIAENMVTIAQGLGSKGNLAHPSTIYKLCKDAGVPLREFARTPRILSLSYITAKRMETISHTMKANTMRPPKASNHTYQACSFSSKPSMRTCKIPSGLHGGGQANKGETRADLPTQPKLTPKGLKWKETCNWLWKGKEGILLRLEGKSTCRTTTFLPRRHMLVGVNDAPKSFRKSGRPPASAPDRI
ncbi:hypothetical protein PIB30_078773, partial [Stylosanthes scabra]|nr:hypothetical protein [Stylosanthes scabra]